MDETLLPDVAELPSGASLVEEGLALGSRIEAGRSAFCDRHGVASEVEFKRSRIAAGELQWSMIMGLASLDDQIDALGFLEDFGERTGVVIDRGLIIPNWVTGLPERLRERAPQGTSFVLGGVEDHVRVSYARQLMMLLPADRPDVFLGGKLNTITDGDAEPRDASSLLREIGVVPCRTIHDLAGHLATATRV